VGRDVTKLFNVLSGYAIETDYDRLLVAPLQLRSGLLERIEREAENARAGLPSGIKLKANSMVDEAIIDALYRASQDGVPIDVWVRGICSIRAGVPGLSENIRVRSVLGRYLEHSRIYAFENAGEREVFIGSADLMHRNLDRRIEVLVRLEDREHLARIDRFFGFAFSDDVSSWRMLSDGSWQRRVVSEEGEPLPDLQDLVMIDRTQARSRRSR
jgi:polyphosphate kinase